MAVDPRKRQKKLMKKLKKDKTRKSRQAEQTAYATLSPRTKVRMARKYPIYECLICPSWRENGLATILISRRQPDGRLTFGSYLVDLLCLGLKDTFCNADMPVERYERELRNRYCSGTAPVECSVSLAHHIIYGAIEFAAQFGFKPDKDFDLSQYVLEDIDDLEPCEEEVEFGRGGKPVYIQGPRDDPEQVMAQIAGSTKEKDSGTGERDFEFTVHEGGPTPLTALRVLEPEEINIKGEVDRIIQFARSCQAGTIVLGPLVFFSTETGDAWLLEPEGGLALQLAQDGERLPFHITETARSYSIGWSANYQIDGNTFVVAESSGRIRAIAGYPIPEILAACRDAAVAEETD